MPCLPIGKRLSPAIGILKGFAAKLHRRLHRLRPSTLVTTAKTRRFKPKPAVHYQSRRHHRATKSRHARLLGASRRFKRKPVRVPAVFIDELFCSGVVDLVKRPRGATTSALVKDVAATSAAEEARGIDDRAEEFIARFRAELEVQEMMAHHL